MKNQLAKTFIQISSTLFCVIGFHSFTFANSCAELFEQARQPIAGASTIAPLIDPSWSVKAESHYSDMLISLGEKASAGGKVPDIGIGNLLYQHASLHPQNEIQYLKIGFTLNETARRIEAPATFAALVTAVEAAQKNLVFKLATYNSKTWFRLDQEMPAEANPEVLTDLPTPIYAEIVANGYTPMWASRTSTSLFHDVTHVLEYIEHPAVFPALQKYFQAYLENGWQSSILYNQRPAFFNEASYILNPAKYGTVESLMVTQGIRLGSLSMHAIQLRKALRSDSETTLQKIRALTDAFDKLFFRHGGGVRDIQGVDMRLRTEIIAHYVKLTKADPSMQTLGYQHPTGFLHEFIESPEGLKRQIMFAASELKSKPTDELRDFIAFRVAQLEIAILTQKKLELSQVDIIEDSMLPPGADSKTSRYLRAYLPPTAQLLSWYR